MPTRAIKHQLTCPFEITSGSFLIGRRRILVIPRNHLEVLTMKKPLRGTEKDKLHALISLTKTFSFSNLNYALSENIVTIE